MYSYVASYTERFTVFNTNVTFPYNDLFKDYTTKYLKKMFNNEKLYLYGNLFEIEYKETDTTTIYKFKSYLQTPNTLQSCALVGQCSTVSNITQNQIRVLLTMKKVDQTIEIDDIMFIKPGLDLDNMDEKLLPSSNSSSNIYFIKNKYHLLDPFLTSSKESVITTPMKGKFAKVLTDKYEKLLTDNSFEYKLL